MPINSIVTLDQLEGSEYLFKVVSTILPSVCLDYKVDSSLMHTYVHPFDILFNPKLGNASKEEEIENAIKQLGINYLLDTQYPKLFNVTIEPGSINLNNCIQTDNSTINPIRNTRHFNDLPTFTRNLVMIRLREPESKARYVGGYVRSPGAPNIMSQIKYPSLSFDNTYLLSLLYQDVVDNRCSGFIARKVNNVIIARDFSNLLGVRALLHPRSVVRFDEDYDIAKAAQDHNVIVNQQPPVDRELTTMKFKHLVMYYQYFSTIYNLGKLTYNGQEVISISPSIDSFVASLHFQQQIPALLQMYPSIPTSNQAIVRTMDANGNMINNTVTINGLNFINISSQSSYYLTLLSMLMRLVRTGKLESKELSLFWDGIDYEEYKMKKLTDIIFYNSTCYVFGLFNHNGVTYCSMLSDLVTAGETPLRVCMLPRVVGGRTVPALISETLHSINSISPKDFPKKSSQLYHIGLSEQGYMKFFQFLRLMTNRTPENAIKEVLMAYAGLKLDDKGSPHHIHKETYNEFVTLLFTSMGFKVNSRKSIMGSHNYTTIFVSPRVSKQYIYNMLTKASCSKNEADKLISTTHDLLNFMVSVGDLRDTHGYRYTRRFEVCPRFFYGGAPELTTTNDIQEPDSTVIQLSEPMNLLDRIDSRSIFAADTVNEMIYTDSFLPENNAFKNNLSQLIENEQLNGETITHAMPLNIIDRLITTAGSYVSIGELMDNLGNDTENNNATNEVVELINSALRDNYARDNTTALVSQAINSVAARSERQLGDVKQSSCQMAMLFKSLARSIYTLEKIFKAKVSDEVKAEILEKYKAFSELSKSLYQDLIAIENLKALMYIIKRSGRQIEDVDIGPEEIRKSYDIIKPKIIRMTNYYTEISRSYFDFMKKNLNMIDGDSVSFDSE